MAVRAHVDVIGDHAPDMQKMLPYFELVDALNAGIDAMREAGPKYLERFPDETADDYRFRLSQTKMTNVFSDITESLASKPFEEPIEIEGNESLIEFAKDVNGAGATLTMFAADVFEAGIRSGIDWIFIDSPKVDTSKIRNQADQKRANIRPYWSRIIAANVLQATPVMVGGDEQLGYFRYREPGTPDKVRVFEMSAGIVTWTLYRDTDKYDEKAQTSFVVEDAGVLPINEIPVVPFMTGRRVGRTFEFNPPMKAAADAQRDIYHQESALKYAKVLAAYPMLSGNGVKPDTDANGNIKPLGIGPQRVLYAPPGNDGSIGSWKYVEPNANTLMFLAKDIEGGIQNLRELGRQPLTAQSSNLTTVTTAFAAGKSKSSVSAWADKLSGALVSSSRITLKWESLDSGAAFTISVWTDFDQFYDGQDVDALNTARAARDISIETYWKEMKRRNILSDGFDPKEEQARLLTESLDLSSDITNG